LSNMIAIEYERNGLSRGVDISKAYVVPMV
jgi:hypothetical protein